MPNPEQGEQIGGEPSARQLLEQLEKTKSRIEELLQSGFAGKTSRRIFDSKPARTEAEIIWDAGADRLRNFREQCEDLRKRIVEVLSSEGAQADVGALADEERALQEEAHREIAKMIAPLSEEQSQQRQVEFPEAYEKLQEKGQHQEGLIQFEPEKTQQLKDEITGKILFSVEGYSAYRESAKSQAIEEYVGDVVSIFLDEAMAAQGINQVEDPERRVGLRQLMAHDIMEGMRVMRQAEGGQIGHWQLRERGQLDDKKATGALLYSLCATQGKLDHAVDFLGAPGPNQAEGVRKHLETINMVRAYSFNAPEFVPKNFDADTWARAFDQKINGPAFQVAAGGPVMPRVGISQTEKEEIQTDFENFVQKAKERHRKMVEVQADDRQKRIESLKHHIEAIDEAISVVREAEELAGESSLHDYLIEETEKAAQAERAKIPGLESNLATYQRQLDETGFFARGRRRELEDSISRTERDIRNARARAENEDKKAATYRRALEMLGRHNVISLGKLEDERKRYENELKKAEGNQ